MTEKHPEMKPYEFVITGTVYAGSETHARHYVYWTLQHGLDEYRDNSAAGIYSTDVEVQERKADE